MLSYDPATNSITKVVNPKINLGSWVGVSVYPGVNKPADNLYVARYKITSYYTLIYFNISTGQVITTKSYNNSTSNQIHLTNTLTTSPNTNEIILSRIVNQDVVYYKIHIDHSNVTSISPITISGTNAIKSYISNSPFFMVVYEVSGSTDTYDVSYNDITDTSGTQLFSIETYSELPHYQPAITANNRSIFTMSNPMPPYSGFINNSSYISFNWIMVFEFTEYNSSKQIYFGTGTEVDEQHRQYGGWTLNLNSSAYRFDRYIYWDSPWGSAGPWFNFNAPHEGNPKTSWDLTLSPPTIVESDIVKIKLYYNRSANTLSGELFLNESLHTTFETATQIYIQYPQPNSTPYYLETRAGDGVIKVLQLSLHNTGN